MRTITVTIEPELDSCTVKDVLSKRAFVSDTFCSRLKRRPGSIRLNGAPVYVTAHVHTGDTVAVAVGDAEKDARIQPIALPLTIVYEDSDLLVIDKPNGLAVHPARDPNEITIENALAAYLPESENPHPVSRLDRGTTGLLTVAKSGWAHSLMKTLQHSGGLQKEYLAVCVGIPKESHGTIDAPIGFFEGSSYRRIVRKDGMPSLSEYEVLQSYDGLSLLRMIPHTGRTHQLRVHMAYIGYPLLGDWLYGTRDERIARPALHAARLCFVHPLTGKKITLFAPLPEDMKRLFPYFTQ